MIASTLAAVLSVSNAVNLAPIPNRYIGQIVANDWMPPAGFTQKVACLTFDDGPTANVTPQVLNVLSSNRIHSTFFMVGKQMVANQAWRNAVFAQGHEIANHTHSHISYPSQSVASFEYLSPYYQILACSGWDNWTFRPPYGQRTATPTVVAQNRGNAIILWTNDSHDWELTDPMVIFSTVMGQKKPGDIILMHDNRPATPAAANLIIQAYKADGYRFVNLNEMLWIWDAYLTSRGR